MKTTALTSTVFALTAATLLGEGKSDVEFLRARADAHERKIVQLEKEIIKLKSYHGEKHAVPAAKTSPAASSKTASVAGTYVVKKGDILTRIAYRHKTTVAAIMKENNLRNDRISIGQKLRIPGAVAAPAPSSTSSGRPLMAKKAAPAKSSSKHIVKKGETFYSIARQHNVSVQSLVAANPKVRPTSLNVGHNLVVDGNAKAAVAKSTPKAKSSNSPKPKAKTPPTRAAEYVEAPKPKGKTKQVVRNAPADRVPVSTASKSSEPAIRTITVHQQMTYGQFASKHGASTTQLNALNGLSLSKNTMLAKGSELYVPKY